MRPASLMALVVAVLALSACEVPATPYTPAVRLGPTEQPHPIPDPPASPTDVPMDNDQ